MRLRPILMLTVLGLAAAGFAGGWFASAALVPPPDDTPAPPPPPVFTDAGLFYINFGTRRQIAGMRAGLLIAPDAAEALSFAALRDTTLRLLVQAAEQPVTLLETRPGPGIVPLDQSVRRPGTVTPDLEALARLVSYTAPDWMLRMRLVSANDPPLLPQIDPPPAEVVPLEEPISPPG